MINLEIDRLICWLGESRRFQLHCHYTPIKARLSFRHRLIDYIYWSGARVATRLFRFPCHKKVCLMIAWVGTVRARRPVEDYLIYSGCRLMISRRRRESTRLQKNIIESITTCLRINWEYFPHTPTTTTTKSGHHLTPEIQSKSAGSSTSTSNNRQKQQKQQLSPATINAITKPQASTRNYLDDDSKIIKNYQQIIFLSESIYFIHIAISANNNTLSKIIIVVTQDKVHTSFIS